MNCTESFFHHVRTVPHEPALWLPSEGVTTFRELGTLAARAQSLYRRHGLRTGDKLLLVEGLSPRLYGLVVGALAMGIAVILVEPWMPVAKIDQVVRSAAPQMIVGGSLGLAWAVRVPAIRAVRSWAHTRSLALEFSAGDAIVEQLSPDMHGVITFTSGTTGNPKGVVRKQGYLVQQYEQFVQSLGLEDETGPDLCIFANFVLVNLTQGRPSVIVPPGWKRKHLRQIDHLPEHLQPTTMSGGPGFLIRALRHARLRRLHDAHIGGALTDAWILEEAMNKWPDARWLHVYGSSEAEPVSFQHARDAVHRSRQRGLFQVLDLGRPVKAIRSQTQRDNLWITGPHVCPMYLDNEQENRLHKRRDEQGRVWHDMGDRIEMHDGTWWYTGRSGQTAEDFRLEQEIYSAMGSSKSFIHRTSQGEPYLIGEGLEARRRMLSLRFPQIRNLVEATIRRDRRHRARIDRKATIEKDAPWLLG